MRLKLLSQNVRSLRSTARQADIDVAVDLMLNENIDAYVIQETWLDRTKSFTVNGFHVLTHGLDKQTCSRGQKGLAIILSPTLFVFEAYQKAGCPKPITPTDPTSIPLIVGRNPNRHKTQRIKESRKV